MKKFARTLSNIVAGRLKATEKVITLDETIKLLPSLVGKNYHFSNSYQKKLLTKNDIVSYLQNNYGSVWNDTKVKYTEYYRGKWASKKYFDVILPTIATTLQDGEKLESSLGDSCQFSYFSNNNFSIDWIMWKVKE